MDQLRRNLVNASTTNCEPNWSRLRDYNVYLQTDCSYPEIFLRHICKISFYSCLIPSIILSIYHIQENRKHVSKIKKLTDKLKKIGPYITTLFSSLNGAAAVYARSLGLVIGVHLSITLIAALWCWVALGALLIRFELNYLFYKETRSMLANTERKQLQLRISITLMWLVVFLLGLLILLQLFNDQQQISILLFMGLGMLVTILMVLIGFIEASLTLASISALQAVTESQSTSNNKVDTTQVTKGLLIYRRTVIILCMNNVIAIIICFTWPLITPYTPALIFCSAIGICYLQLLFLLVRLAKVTKIKQTIRKARIRIASTIPSSSLQSISSSKTTVVEVNEVKSAGAFRKTQVKPM